MCEFTLPVQAFILPFSVSHCPSLCSLFTMVTTHLISAEKEKDMPVASVSTWGVKAWTGQSTRTWQGFVPWQRQSLCLVCGPHGKSKALWLIMQPVGSSQLGNTLGTFVFLASHGICCSGSQMSKSNLEERSFPEQCLKGLQSYSGSGEVPTVILWSFTYKCCQRKHGIEDSFSLADKIKNL